MFNLLESFWVVFWAAATLFLVVIVTEFYLRHKAAKKRALETPHPDRIEFALHHIRHKGIKEIDNNLWEKITGVSHATATRDLALLVDMGILKQHGGGRGTHYTFVKHQKN